MENDSRSFTPTFTGAPHFRLPFRSVFMPIVPCVLDGCLSLLELIAKLEYIVNQYHDAIEANHTDIVNLAAYIDGALDDLREYIDTQDAATLASAKAYTDSAITTLTAYVNEQDAATLALAKAYTDAALVTAKAYTDAEIASLRAYTDAQLALKQDLLTFDQTPTDGSSNPVTSDGIYDAIAAARTYADNTFQIKNDFAIATRSQHGTDPTTITCNILFTTLIAYNQQNRVTVVKMTDDIDLAPANVHWFYFAGFEYDSREMPITAWFIGYNGKLSCNSLNEWTFTNW
jgi:hypothetical protein